MTTLPLKEKLQLRFVPELLKRLLRIRVFNILEHEDMKIVVLNKKILFIQNSKILGKVMIDRGTRPLNDGLEIVNNYLYYGDYWGNKNRDPVNLYRINLNNFRKEVFYVFKCVRHIHFIQEDNYQKGSLLVGTGDKDRESGIYRINISTKKLDTLCQGDQRYRVVSILQTKEKLLYGSDDPDGQNFIYEFCKKTYSTNKLLKIHGPAYYSTVDKQDFMYIATTIENRQKHKAIIYMSKDRGKTWQKYKKFKKDIWHVKYFGYGVIEFTNNRKNPENLSYNLIGLKEEI